MGDIIGDHKIVSGVWFGQAEEEEKFIRQPSESIQSTVNVSMKDCGGQSASKVV